MKSQAFIPRLFNKDSLLSLHDEFSLLLTDSPLETYFKDIHIDYPILLDIQPDSLNKLLQNLLSTNDFYIDTVELHIQRPNSPPIPPHQDNFYHCTEYNKSLKVLVPLQELNIHNGGLIYLDCDYDFPVIPHSPSCIPNFSSYIDDSKFRLLNYPKISYEYKLGDASYHFINSVHFSKGNSSSKPSMFLVYRFITYDAKEDDIAIRNYLNCVERHKKLISNK